MTQQAELAVQPEAYRLRYPMQEVPHQKRASDLDTR